MKQYLLSVVAAAIISGIVTKLLGTKGTQGAIGKLVAGLFLAFTVISPLRSVRIADFSDLAFYATEAEAAVAEGKKQTQQALQTRIKENCEAYILDKARFLNMDLEVVVTLSDGDMPTPEFVQLSGNASPNAKAKLTDIISEDLGVPKEAQQWI